MNLTPNARLETGTPLKVIAWTPRPAVRREFLPCVSASGEIYTKALEELDREFGAYRRGVLMYEPGFCTQAEPADSSRILTFSPSKLAKHLEWLSQRMSPEDFIIPDVELGHPFHGPAHKRAIEDLAKGIDSQCANRRGFYGLLKPCKYPQTGMVYHDRDPWTATAAEMDRAMAEVMTNPNEIIVVEIYLTHVTAPNNATLSSYAMRERDQRAWIRNDIARARTIAAGRPVLAMVKARYVTKGISGRDLAANDRRLILQELQAADVEYVGLWDHMGREWSTPQIVRRDLKTWASEAKGYGYGPKLARS